MSERVRIINGKGDWEDTPPTGADDHDLQSFANDFLITGGVVKLADGMCLVEELDTPAMKVKVAPGVTYVENSSWTESSFEPRFYIVVRDAEEELDISSNSSGLVRTDLICQKIDKVTTPDDTASNVCPLIVVEGTPGAGAPALPADHEAFAEVAVPDGATTIENADITDVRRMVGIDPDLFNIENPKAFFASAASGVSYSANQTIYTSPADVNFTSPTESNVQFLVPAGRIYGLYINLSSNTQNSGNTVVTSRVAGADHGPSVTIASGVTGNFSDETEYEFAVLSLLSLKWALGGTSGALGVRSVMLGYTPA